MQIHNVEQGSPEWFELRKLKFTASKATAVINGVTIDKKTDEEKIGAGLKTLVYEMLSDKYSGWTNEAWEGNDNTENGNEMEELARGIYELETGNTVEIVGFCELDKYTGCSPDGLVGTEGLWENKWKKNQNYFRRLMEKGKPDSDHDNQVQFQMYVTGRKWCDLTYYNPNFVKAMDKIRIERDEDVMAQIKIGLAKGIEMIKDIEAKYNKLINA